MLYMPILLVIFGHFIEDTFSKIAIDFGTTILK